VWQEARVVDVFYCDNGGPQALEYKAAFQQIMVELHLRGAAYSGIGIKIRQSSLDREITDDLYSAKYVVALFTKDPADSWIASELGAVRASGQQLFVFSTRPVSDSSVVPSPQTVVEDPTDFGEALTERLKQVV
jgi:hypothetical protein